MRTKFKTPQFIRFHEKKLKDFFPTFKKRYFRRYLYFHAQPANRRLGKLQKARVAR